MQPIASIASLAAALLIGAASITLAQTQPTPAPSTPPPAVTAPPLTPPVAKTRPSPGGGGAVVAPVARKKAAVPKTATTPEGVTCSAEADAKGLKGKERRRFRSKCISAIKKGAAKPAAARPAAAPPSSILPPPGPAPAPKN